MTLDADDVARLDATAACSALLARVFLRPADDELLARLADPRTMADWPLATDENADARALLTRGARTARDVLASEFQRLFVGPGRLPAPPWESVYRSVDRLLFDEHTIEVRQAYAAAGLAAPEPGREPDDHVGLEFDFVATLAARAVAAADEGDDSEAGSAAEAVGAFLDDHLCRWAPTWAGQLAVSAEQDFYRGAALLAVDLLDQVGTAAGPTPE